MKKLAVGLSAAFAVICSPAHSASTIKVAVAPTFATAANDIIGAFQSYYFTTYGLAYNVTVVVKGAQQIQADIIAGSTYDLFLSSSVDQPYYLANNYPALVSGSLFNYARDRVDLFSETMDVTGGLPSTLTTNLVIPDPTKDDYGVAAAQILGSSPWNIPESSIPGGYVFTKPSVGSSFAAIDLGSLVTGGRIQQAGGALAGLDLFIAA